jgi:O-antigen/teichoic acid export membrane protein
MSTIHPQMLAGLINRPFVRQISGMILLTAMGQGIYLLIGPLLGRLYLPDQLGYYGLFFTIWMVAQVFACLIYDQAITVADGDDEARHVTIVCIVLCGLLSVTFGAFFAVSIAQGWFGLGAFSIWAGPLLTIALMIGVANQIAQNWRIRSNEVLKIGRSNLSLNGVRGACQVGLGFINPVWSLLIVGEIIGRIVSTRQLLGGLKANIFGSTLKKADRSIVETILRHRGLPLAFGPALVLDATAMMVQISALGMLFGPSIMGQYFLMKRTLDMPVSFAVKSVGDAIYARQILEARDAPEKLRLNFVRSAVGLAAIGLVAGLPVMLFGPQLFKLFYGPNWGLAGTLAAITTPAIILNLAISPISRVFSLSQHPHLRIIPGFVVNFSIITVFLAAVKYHLSITYTVALLSGATIMYYMSYFIAGYIAAGKILERSH